MGEPTGNGPRPRAGVAEIEPYVGGRTKAQGDKIFKLSANETPLGASAAAKAAFAGAGDKLALYPDGSAAALREAIGAHYGLNPDRLVCGAGSDELLHLLAQAYLGEGDEAICSEHGFLVYPIVTQAAGAQPVFVPDVDLTASVDNILGAVTPRTRMVFLANPNNPTGSYLPAEDVRRLHQGLRGDILLVLDGAYAEYVRRNDYEAGIELVATSKNVVMTRTFSKIYGLAALRLGWAYCPAGVAEALNKIRGPFNVNVPAMEAGIAALGDVAHMDQAVAHNDKWLAWLSEQIEALGLKVWPSVANFLLIDLGSEARAKAADDFLLTRGLVLRQVGAYGLGSCLRLTVGLEEANRLVVGALGDFLKQEDA